MSSSNSKIKQKTNGKKSRKGRKIPSAKNYKLIFDKMEDGKLKVDLEEVRIYTLYKGKWIEPYISKQFAPSNPYRPYLFVTIYYKSQRRKVSVHRLMWMVHNGQEYIPRGYDVGHDDDDTENNHYSNLDLEPARFNRRNSSTF